MRARTWLLCGAALLSGGLYWARREPAAKIRSQPHREHEAAELALQPRRLQRREDSASLAERAFQVFRTPAAAPSAAPARDEAAALDAEEPREEPTVQQRLAESQAQQTQLYAQLERRFSSERVDGVWRRETEARLNDALAATDPSAAQVQLESVDCRSDICKMTLTHASPRPAPEFVLRFIKKAAAGLENHFEYEDGRTTMYSLRRDDAAPRED